MRIAVDGTPLIGQTGGVGTFVRGLLGELVTRPELSTTAYALSWRGRHALGALVPAGVATVTRPLAAAPLLSTWDRTNFPPIEFWTGAVDVVHGTNFVVPPTRSGAAVVTVHDLTALKFPELCAPASLRYPQAVKRAVDRGAFVHTPSAYVAAEVIELLGVAEHRVRPVAHGVIDVPASAMPRPWPFPYVLALGTVEPRKDLPTLVRAFDEVAARDRDVRLVIAGVDGWGAATLTEAVAAARHRDRVIRETIVDDQRRAALLTHAAVFAYPSVYEGFGLPPLEAMAMGCPVVATAVGALPEVVADAAVLIAPSDHDALAAALLAVMSSPGKAAGLVDRGRQRVGKFTWSACCDGLLALYAAAIAESG